MLLHEAARHRDAEPRAALLRREVGLEESRAVAPPAFAEVKDRVRMIVQRKKPSYLTAPEGEVFADEADAEMAK